MHVFHRSASVSCLAGISLMISLVFLATTELSAQGKKRNASPPLVEIGNVVMKPRATTQSFVGSLAPIRRAVIGSAVEERVEEVPVEEGDFVSGDLVGADQSAARRPVLVQLRRETIDIEVATARIELQLREKALQELSVSIPKEIEAAQAEVGRLEAEMNFAKKVFDRMQGLATNGGLSPREMEESSSQYRSASQSFNGANADLQLLQATREIKLAIASQNIARQQAEVDRVLDMQSKYTVVAPFDGYVTRKMVERGNWVTRGTPLVELVQLDPIELRVNVPQDYAVRLQQSFDAATEKDPLLAEITVDSIENPLNGQVVRIVPDADPRTRSLPVIIRIDNPAIGDGGHLLKPGLLARAVLEIGKGESVMMAPKDSLVLNQGMATVFVIDRSTGKPSVRGVDVTTGSPNGSWIEIIGDVKPGDEVVIQGNERIRDGQIVDILDE